MSANAIARRYPPTEAVFQQLRINRNAEGDESMEELAWRHGMDVAQVLEQLERIATTLRPSSPSE